eukprot:TRINITY_DN15790_c1_g2_i4.p1 TRINITY_DN15790_c1_g2~~TRINITY_DN15790_c1_g2_i4.p1  ORF type:complete len:747 (-),score=127.66 TRINITY_DN15790_c1_g2_i4:64-2259(-)
MTPAERCLLVGAMCVWLAVAFKNQVQSKEGNSGQNGLITKMFSEMMHEMKDLKAELKTVQEENKGLKAELNTVETEIKRDPMPTFVGGISQETEPKLEDLLPAWTHINFKRLNITENNCRRKSYKAMELAELQLGQTASQGLGSQGAEPVIYASGKQTTCPSDKIKLQRFADGKVYEQCCPSDSFACSGCVQLQGSTCQTCESGYTKSSSSNGAQCVACQDALGWEDRDGKTCLDYEKQNWCAAGAPTATGQRSHGNTLELFFHKGLSPTAACCACGGGSRIAAPFLYPTADKPVALGQDISVSPFPRTTAEYSVQECFIHEYSMKMEGSTGKVTGKVEKEPGDFACKVTSHEAGGLKIESDLTLSVVYFAYPAKVLLVKPGASWTPAKKNGYGNFRVKCTPDLPWLSINANSGVLTASNTAGLSPRSASCSVTAKIQECKTDSSGAKTCADVDHSTQVQILVPKQTETLVLVNQREPTKMVHQMLLRVEEEVAPYKLVVSLDAKEMKLYDTPQSFRFDCGADTAFNALTGTLMYKGYDVFTVSSQAEINGVPGADLMRFCINNAARCQLTLQCKAYGILPFTGKLIKASFEVIIQDSVCWRYDSTTYQISDATDGPTQQASCQQWCRNKADCAGFVWQSNKCHAVRNVGKVMPTAVGEGFCTGATQVYGSAAWALSGSSRVRKDFDSADYAAWQFKAAQDCLQRDSQTTFVSVQFAEPGTNVPFKAHMLP